MKVTFPAMQGKMGQRQYYSTMLSLSEIPRLFSFNDWEQFTPEHRAQRVLNKNRVPDIAKYILDNEDGYLFSSITASYSSDAVTFIPITEGSDIGHLEMELENVEFIINDGQHRCAAIAAALSGSLTLGKERISVLLFPQENLDRLQQMFSDLNRFAHKTSKSLDVLYDHRDNLSALTVAISEAVPVFKGMLDKEKISIPLRSPKLFTLSTLYDANEELLGTKIDKKGTKDFGDKLEVAVQYWNAIAEVISDWEKVKEGSLKAAELRQEKINTHAVVMRALGGLGKTLFEVHPKTWRKSLEALKGVDWRKSTGEGVNPTWDNVCIAAGSVVSNRQARVATLTTLKRIVGLESIAYGKSIRRKEENLVEAAQA